MLEFNTYLIYRLSVLFFTLHNNPRNSNDQPMKSSRTEDMDEAPRLHKFTKEELSQYLIDCQLLNPTEADEIRSESQLSNSPRAWLPYHLFDIYHMYTERSISMAISFVE